MGRPAKVQKVQPQAAPKHAPVELGAFETAPVIELEEDGPMHRPMHGGMHNDGPDADMHFGGEIHTDDMEKNWAPPTQLDAPEPRPGMKQRWIRSSLLGKSDGKNISLQGGQGWRPRTLSSVPEGDRKRYPTSKDARTSAEFMVNGDLVLCEIPERMFNQMRDHYRGKSKGQTDALIDANLASAAVKGGERHGMGAPHVEERHSRVTTRRPIVASD
jgi:hypothetical protein